MLKMRYVGEQQEYQVTFGVMSENVVHISGDFPKKEKGFILSRQNRDDEWDYKAYDTIYAVDDETAYFSNDGSVRLEE